jgi:hypothetical protein
MMWQRSCHSPVSMDWTRYVYSAYALDKKFLSLLKDGIWVRYMARADRATQMRNEEPIAIVLELPEELQHVGERPASSLVALAARDRFVKDIRWHVANNRAVVIKGCCFSQCRGFSVEDIGMVRPSMSHSVYWQGKCIKLLLLLSQSTYR